MKHSTGKPTKYEQQRFDAILKLGCVCCAQLGIWNIAVDIHHIVDGKRLGHWYTLPVCPGHHRGAWSPEQVDAIPPDLRIAISDGSKVFEKQYGTERDLWMKVQARLKLPAVWPTSKILPRRGYAQAHCALVEMAPGTEVLPTGYGDSSMGKGSSPALDGQGGAR